MIDTLIQGLLIGSWGWLWTNRLTYGDMLGVYLYEWYKKLPFPDSVKQFVAKPLFLCSICHTFWFSIVCILVFGMGWAEGAWLVLSALFFVNLLEQLWEQQ